MTTPRSFAPIIATVLLLLPVLYVGSYLALVNPSQSRTWDLAGTPFHSDYRYVGQCAARLF